MSTEKQKGAKSTNTEFPFKLGPEGHRPCLEGHDGAVASGKERTTGHRQRHSERFRANKVQNSHKAFRPISHRDL